MRIQKFGLRLTMGQDFDVVNPESDPRYKEIWRDYHRLMGRRGVTPEAAKAEARRDTTLIGALLLRRGDADALICGTYGRPWQHLHHVEDVIGRKPGAKHFATMNALVLPRRTVFITDTYVNDDPDAEQVADIALMAAEELRRFGIAPKVALLSHSNFGSSRSPSASKMSRALQIIRSRAPNLEVDGEMHGDAALSEELRHKVYPESTLKGEANLLVMPNLDAANIAFNLLKITGGDGVTVGPILLGAARSVHILTPSATVRRLVNITAIAVVDGQLMRA
jgi:malate dehydrogenase (oxaloacetate-decarboxylating)(NADP+)